MRLSLMKPFPFLYQRAEVVAPYAQGQKAFLPDSSEAYQKFGKRAFDVMFAIVLIPLVFPIVAGAAFAVSRDGGSAFFGHKRVGRDGKVFKCWKIRSMVVDAETKLQEYLKQNPDAAEEWERDHKLDDDPRITAFGNFLRKSSVDELPQIWNVLRGDMSFVGPRPIVRAELKKYGAHRTPIFL